MYTASMGAVDPATDEVVSDDVVEPADQAITNTVSILAGVGCALSDVMKVTLYLTDPADYDRVNRVYAERFDEHRPVRTCIVAANLPARERVKLGTIAYLGDEG